MALKVVLFATLAITASVFAAPSPAMQAQPESAQCTDWVTSPTPLALRHSAGAWLTAHHVVVWGGGDGNGNAVLDGASLDRRTGQWTPMAEACEIQSL